MGTFGDPVVIIFGASQSLGRAVSAAFARRGARVVVIDKDSDALRDLCAENPDRVEALVIKDMHGRLADLLQEAWGAERIDIAINLMPLAQPDDVSQQIRLIKQILQMTLRGLVRAKGAMVTVLQAPADSMALERQGMKGAIMAVNAALAVQLAAKKTQIHGLGIRPKDTAAACEALLFLASPQGRKLRSTQLDLDVLLPD